MKEFTICATSIHNLPQKKFRRDPLLQPFFYHSILTTTLFFLSFFFSLFFTPSWSLLRPHSRCGRHVSIHYGPLVVPPFPHRWSSVFSSFLTFFPPPLTLFFFFASTLRPLPPKPWYVHHVTLFWEVVVALKRAFGVMRRRWWLVAGADRPHAHTPTS